MNQSKTLVAHQPCYLPWLGFINKLFISNIFVSMNDVKFSKNSMYARNYIKIQQKKILLTVPTNNADKNKIFKDVKICGSSWAKEHMNKINLAYSKKPFYKNYIKEIEEIYSKNWVWICDLNHEILFLIKKIFNIKTQIEIASNFNFEGDKNSRLINYCKKFNAQKYVFGKNGKKYANEDVFLQNKISIKFQDFSCPNENLSFLDYLFNFGTTNINFLMKEEK